MKSEKLTSLQNPKIKELVSLCEKSRMRREKGLFIVEGLREIEHCLNAGYNARSIFYVPEIAGQKVERLYRDGVRMFEIPHTVFSKLAYREDSDGIIAEIFSRELRLADIEATQDPLYIVLESVEKPGNIGAVLRSADAANADAVIICDPKCDIYNPNIIRSSIGAVFTNRIAVCETDEAIRWLKSRNISILTAQLQDSEWYYDCDMTKGTAIVMGSEDKGLGNEWREAADKHIKIPMLGEMDSLNVSVSAAILMFEAVRQRNS